MRKFIASLIIAVSSQAAYALPPIPKYIISALKDKPASAEYAKSVEAAAMKCSSCHVPGADKKAKGHGLNDFGKAIHKHLDDKAFMAADKDKDTAKATELFLAAWDKTVIEKNEAGVVYGDLIKEGKLPGKNE